MDLYSIINNCLTIYQLKKYVQSNKMKLKITPFKKKLPLVCVQGLGVVGSAILLLHPTRNKQPIQCYWTRKKTKSGKNIIQKINNGKYPFSYFR